MVAVHTLSIGLLSSVLKRPPSAVSPVLEGVVGKTHVTAVALRATGPSASGVSCILAPLLHCRQLLRFVALWVLSLLERAA